jgi:hypothetical protein
MNNYKGNYKRTGKLEHYDKNSWRKKQVRLVVKQKSRHSTRNNYYCYYCTSEKNYAKIFEQQKMLLSHTDLYTQYMTYNNIENFSELYFLNRNGYLINTASTIISHDIIFTESFGKFFLSVDEELYYVVDNDLRAVINYHNKPIIRVDQTSSAYFALIDNFFYAIIKNIDRNFEIVVDPIINVNNIKKIIFFRDNFCVKYITTNYEYREYCFATRRNKLLHQDVTDVCQTDEWNHSMHYLLTTTGLLYNSNTLSNIHSYNFGTVKKVCQKFILLADGDVFMLSRSTLKFEPYLIDSNILSITCAILDDNVHGYFFQTCNDEIIYHIDNGRCVGYINNCVFDLSESQSPQIKSARFC